MVSHAWTIGKRHKKKKRASSPGPGEYKKVDMNLVRVAPPEWTIKGKYPYKLEANDGPGPGTYSHYSKRPGSAYTIQGKRNVKYMTEEPGPGAYSLWQSYDHIGGYIGEKTKKGKYEASPGPAAYSLSQMSKSHQGWTFGMNLSDKFKILDCPGPGTYDSWSNKSYILGKFGRETRGEKSTHWDSPGPGTYGNKSGLSTNGWTIQGKRKHRSSSEEDPGPGTYFPFLNDRGPAYSIGGKNKKKSKAYDGPAPDTYFPSIKSTHPRPKSAKFTSGRKDRSKGGFIPGPGEYYIGSTLGGPAASMKGRPKTSKRSDYPGPGQYLDKYKVTKPRAKSAKMGKAKRMKKYKDDIPGPGYYGTWDVRGKRGAKMGKAKRPNTAKAGDGPGPGAYDLRSTIGQKPGKTIAGKRKQKSVDDTPGPGMYNPQLGRGPAYSLQGKYGYDYEIAEAMKKPGPSQYFPSVDPIKPHHPGKSLGSKRKGKDRENAPGPGAYNFYDTHRKGKGWSMASRPQTADTYTSPGPAAYFPNPKNDAPAYTIGGPHRRPYNDELSPGPQYDIPDHWNKGILMGKEKRLQYSGEEYSKPGPGAYVLPPNKGKGITMGSKYPLRDLENFPGPGAYDASGKKGGPHYSIAGVGVGQKYSTVSPGPAAYNLVQSYQQVYNAKPGKSFGQKAGLSGGDQSMPGPGTYYLPKNKSDGITMKGRYPDHLYETSPGPAAYNQKWQTIQNLVDTGKGVSMGGGKVGNPNNFNSRSGNPGPGSYYSPSKLPSAGTKFGTGVRTGMKGTDNPGPGYYYIPCTVADVPKYVLPNPDPRYKWV